VNISVISHRYYTQKEMVSFRPKLLTHFVSSAVEKSAVALLLPLPF
jgi:hypothetical protein